MKLLSIAVPCYNSEGYMENCVKSLLVGGDEVEILIVDDGSTDRTAEIADRLEKEHPGMIRAIHQPNKGHGGAVNTGIANASGLYFKVVDSDDKVRASAYKSILDTLRRYSGAPDGAGVSVRGPEAGGTAEAAETADAAAGEAGPRTEGGEAPLDLLISNFVYNKEDENRHNVMQFRKSLPTGRVFSWDEANRFPVGKYILMHAVIFRTQLLRDCGLQLPEHTFYVDNIYVFNPLPWVDRMFYLDVNFYYYYIGREDQSVHESVMIRRLDQQARVNRLMIDYFTDPDNQSRIGRHRILRQYMFNYLEIITTITSVLSLRSGAPEHMQLRDDVWTYLREKDPALYKKMRYRPLGRAMNVRRKVPRMIVVRAYKIAQRMFNFS
ncbi:MAG: glycosyltransferase family 2 protein [Eubacteriales bacterium]|nr:glycosyltransferase family 2 protein [Eubacteriales bacterium]